jgi:SPP1 gp7 family putative phage head morphogenesis protein
MAETPQEARERMRREQRNRRERYARAQKAEIWYGARLREAAAQIGSLASIYRPDDPESVSLFTQSMREYSKALRPWARGVASGMIEQVAKRNEMAWQEHGREMGRALREEIQSAPTGLVMRELMAAQVDLITSLPLEAAQRVHELAIRGISEGERHQKLIEMIMATGEVTKARATLIARTETARTSSTLTEARARYVGSPGYIWRTMKDESVRHLHVQLEGQYIRWDNPPVSGERGERAHAGCIYNCRCYPEVVFYDLDMRQAA